MSAITLTHKIRLDPTCKQESYLRQACGVARFTWNWALSQWKKQYEAGHKPNGLDLKKQFNAIKPVEFPWTYHQMVCQPECRNGLHKLTSHLTGHYGAIAIEDLNVTDMLKHRCLARAIADMGFHELRRQLIYKAQMRGNHIEIVDR